MKLSFIGEYEFLCKISIILIVFQYQTYDCMTLSMVLRFQFLSQLNFLCMQTQFLIKNMLCYAVARVKLLTMMTH